MRRKVLFILAIILIVTLFHSAVFAQSQQITNGLNYLTSTQNPDGSWGNDLTGAEVLPSTVLAIEALQSLNQSNTQSYSNALLWLQSQGLDTTDYLSERIHALSVAGNDDDLLISYLDEIYTDAWGGYDDFETNNLDTALALQALKAVNYTDQNVVSSALFYLTSTQNPDGGFGFYQGDDSNVYMTALVSSTLQQFSQTTSIATAINKATAFLIAHQNADGGFASTGSGGASAAPTSTVFETAYAYMALVGVTTDNTVLGNTVNYLKSTQSTDGSWLQDPYSTALALRALYLAENKPTPPPSPTTGTVTGRIVDASTNQPLSGVNVQGLGIGGQGLVVNTDSLGTFTLPNLSAGSQTITVSLSGYSALSTTINITAGSIHDLGTVALSSSPTTGMIRGAVTDASNSQPLEGVTITVTGSYNWTAVTGANGSFIFTDVTPGTVTITASKTGYYPVTATGAVAAGMIINFNPQLSATPPTSTTGSLTGKVLDSATRSALQGVTVRLSGDPSGVSDAQGGFRIDNITPGTYAATIAFPGYISQTYQLLIVAGSTADMQTIYLYLEGSPQTTTVTGMVTDAAGMPITGATVTVSGTNLSATTDAAGDYEITGITTMDCTVTASATGYNSMTSQIASSGYGTYQLDFALNQSSPDGLKITLLATDKQSYTANEDIHISATLLNAGTATKEALVSGEVQDPAGNVIAITAPAEPNISVSPQENLQLQMKWNTGQFAPAAYKVVIKLKNHGDSTGNQQTGRILGDLAATLTVVPSPALLGTISLNPPATQADMQTPVAITALIRNTGNIPLTASLRLEASLNGTVVYAKDADITALPVNNIISPELGSFIPQSGGEYLVTLKPTDPLISSNISTTLYSGPHVTATFTVTPDKAVSGDARVTGKVDLQGIGAFSGVAKDPLAPVIKDAIQKGVNYIQPEAINWHNRYGCYGCHIQSQALVGLERSRGNVTVENMVTETLFNALKGWQTAGTGKITQQVYLDPVNPPRQIMLQFATANSWEHRAYWGENLILSSTPPDSPANRYMGPLPPAGQWVKLEIDPYELGLANTKVHGVSYVLYGGRVYWDSTIMGDGQPAWVEDSLPPGAAPNGTNESWNWVAAPVYSGTLAHASSIYSGLHQHYFTGASPVAITVEGIEADNPSNNYYVMQTSLALWAFSSKVDSEEAKPYILKAANFIKKTQLADGSWRGELAFNWWNDPAPLTWAYPTMAGTPYTAYNIIGLRKAYELSGDNSYRDAITKAAVFLSTGNWYSQSIITAAHTVIGLAQADKVIDDPQLKSAIQNTISSAVEYLRSGQVSDGGFGRNPLGAAFLNYLPGSRSWKWVSGSDPLITAQAVYAFNEAGVDPKADFYRNAVNYLLNTQGADGAWSSNYMQTNLAATTWVITALPSALDAVMGAQADVKITMPSDITLNNATPKPTHSTLSSNATVYTWQFSSVSDAGRDITLDLTLRGLGIGETRNVAKQANIIVKNTYSGGTASIPINIPSVTGIARLTTSVSTDKPAYGAAQDVTIADSIINNTWAIASPTVQVFIEDYAGNRIASIASFTADSITPNIMTGWNYRIPVSVTGVRDVTNKIAVSNMDFSTVLSGMGITGKIIDQNSVRVIEVDASGNIIGEKQARAVFQNANNARISWFVDGLLANGATRMFHIYFDTDDNGPKAAPTMTKVPDTGSLIGYTDDSGNLYIQETNRDGTFGSRQFVDNTGSGLRGLILDDFNGDGYMDIVAGSGATGVIYFYKNRADGTNTFNTRTTIGTIAPAAWIMGMTAGDFNKDGKKDFVVSGNNTSLYLFTGSGDGTFAQSGLPAPAGSIFLRGKAVADFDGDGNSDFVTASYPGGKVSLYKGNGNGTFSAPVLSGASGEDPYGVIAGDFDEDGKLDLIVHGGSAGQAYFYRGKGDATFASPTSIFSLNTGAYAAVATGDFNNDGHLDVLSANFTSKTITYYPGNGNVTFSLVVSIGTTPAATLGIGSSPPLTELRVVAGAPEVAASRVYNFIWNTGSILAGDYRVHVILSDGQGIISESYAAFTVLSDVRVSTNIAADRISYGANAPVALNCAVTSLSVNAILQNLTSRVTIADAAGVVLLTDSRPILMLTQGQLVEFKTYWNTTTNPPGTYPVTLEVRDTTGALLSTSTAALTISSDIKPSKLLKGQISVDKPVILQGEPLNITYNITNIGNMDLPDIALSVLTVHVVKLTAYDTLNDRTALLKGETYSNTQQLATNNYSAKDYLVILRAGISGVEETIAGTYFRVEGAPSAPSLHSPQHGTDIDTPTPPLTINNASDPNDDKLSYQFEIYTDSGLSNLISSSGLRPEGTGTTSWQAPVALTENTWYFWRARAYDSNLYGEWMTPAAFRMNVTNEAPTAPGLSSPSDSASVDTTMALLTVNNASDPDSVSLTYNFVVAPDPGFATVVATQTGVFGGPGTTSWQVTTVLQENTWYYWTAQADDWLVTGPWMTTARFFVNTTNEAPSAPVIIDPVDGSMVAWIDVLITALNSADPESSALTCLFEADTTQTFDSLDKITSGSLPQGAGSTSWLATGLRDNTWYYARVKANDGLAESPWSTVVRFFVNTRNNSPASPVLANPSNGSGVNAFNPLLSVYNSSDPDGDVLTYEFEVYEDASITNLVSAVSYIQEMPQITAWAVTTPLIENSIYYWRARAFDGQLYSPWMPVASFMVNTANDAPGAPALYAPVMGSSLATLTPTLSVDNATDPDSDTLTYDYEIYSGGTLVQGVTGITQNASGITSFTLKAPLSDNKTYQWRARAYDGDRYGAWMDMASFSVHLPSTSITATIDFDPNTLNQKSKGNWVAVYIELPVGYYVGSIDISSLRLEGTIAAESWPYAIGDYDHDGIPDLMVKFNRNSVINLLPNGDRVQVHVTGIAGSTTFEGVDTIRVIH